MLDIKKLGIKLASLRKASGYSQEKLANLLCVSPQAISKWENGHSMPETSLLPVLAQIWGCTIDEIIMPAYSLEEKAEEEKTGGPERQAELIAERVIQKMEGRNMFKNKTGLDDDIIVGSILNACPNIGGCEVSRGTPIKTEKYTSVSITVAAPQNEFKLIQKTYPEKSSELYNFGWIKDYTLAIPQIYHINADKKIILMEDLSENYVRGDHYNESGEAGEFVRENLGAMIRAAAKFHAAFWEDHNAFGRVGLPWRLDTKENLLAHISAMEKDYKQYRANEEKGKIPKVWNLFENNLDMSKLDYYQTAIDLLRKEYAELIDARFNSGKNVTVIHGDMHPGTMFISKAPDRAIKFVDMQAVRIGLCTEDLAMLLALHIEADKKYALPLLEQYYAGLCERVKDYPYETFLSDYKISVMENMFFPLLLMKRGIYDFSMRDKALRAFEAFVLGG